MVRSLKGRLNQVLVKSGIVTQKSLDRAVEIQKKKGGSISEILINKGMVNEDDLVGCLGDELKLPPINLSRYEISQELITLIPKHVARHYQVVPISKLEKTLTVAMADPLNVYALDDLKTITGCNIQPVIGVPSQILDTIAQVYDSPEGMEELAGKKNEAGLDVEIVSKGGEDEKIDASLSDSSQAPIIRIANLILIEALKKRASDIHIEPFENRIRVRFRIDGILQEVYSPPKAAQSSLITRIKIMAKLDITERRQPQDGRFKIRTGGHEIDFRVSCLPTVHGEKVVLRVLDKQSLKVALEDLGFLPESLKQIEEILKRPHGMILITGPTGSGKSTTLYSILKRLNTPEKNIITVEDPVEYQIEGITQIPVNSEIGLNFSTGLRSILRQSPDIVLIGEIRDAETADIAIKASLTGQLVFSTLHTNTTVGTVTRLIDMGVEPFLVASSIVLIVAQRLCRKICSSCKAPCQIPEEVLDRLGLRTEKGMRRTYYRGTGCEVCQMTGFRGRIATLEVFKPDDTIRDMILKGVASDEIETYARSKGMRSLRENILEQFSRGLTTLEEVLRVTGD